MYVVPLHEVAGDGGLEWAASAGFSRGVPDQVSKPRPLPSVIEVLNAFRLAGCHGTAWFEVGGVDAGEGLPGCPDPGADSADQVFVVWPGERIADLVEERPW